MKVINKHTVSKEFHNNDIFFAYVSQDYSAIRPLVTALEDEGLNIWSEPLSYSLDLTLPMKTIRAFLQSRIHVWCISRQSVEYVKEFEEKMINKIWKRKEKVDVRIVFLILDDASFLSGAHYDQILYYSANTPEITVKKLKWATLPTLSIPHWTSLDGPTQAFSLGHTNYINSIAINANGSYLLSGSEDNTLMLWDIYTGRGLRVLEGHKGPVHSVAFSPDGTLALSGSEDSTTRIWDLIRGTEMRVLEGHLSGVNYVTFSPDGMQCVSGGDDGTLRLWDIHKGEIVYQLDGHQGPIHSAAFIPDGSQILSGGDDGILRFWDVNRGKLIKSIEGSRDSIWSVAISQDGSKALTGSSEGSICIWDLLEDTLIQNLEGHHTGVNCVTFSPDGSQVLSGANDNNLRLWDVSTGQLLQELIGHLGWIKSVVFSPDGNQCVSGSEDMTVRIWNLSNGKFLKKISGYQTEVDTLALSLNATQALSSSHGDTKQFWDLFEGKALEILSKLHNKFNILAISPNSNLLLTDSDDFHLKLWDIDKGKVIRTLYGHYAPVVTAAFNQDGSLIITAAYEELLLWEVSKGESLQTLKGPPGEATSVAISYDGKRVAAGGRQTIWVLDLFSGELVSVFQGHHSTVSSLSFSQDGTKVLSGSYDSTIRLWDIDRSTTLRVLEGHQDDIRSVAISPNGQQALSGASDGTIIIWDLQKGKSLQVINGHQGEVISVAFGKSGEYVFSGALNGVIRRWLLSSLIGEATVDQSTYTNAKVLLVGNSAAGKSGLANRLALDTYHETDSTVGAWATQWQLPIEAEDGTEREVWLWDFGGQADQRLIHQLYMDQAQVAVLVFDPQKDRLLEGLRVWDRDLSRAAVDEASFQKLLVAGRIDAGGLRDISKVRVEEFVEENDYSAYIETSAKEDIGISTLKDAIVELIDWEGLAIHTAPEIFKRLREEIIQLKDQGDVLLTLSELEAKLRIRMPNEGFEVGELKTVIKLLDGPGVVWQLGFGDWVLLKPELVNAYAQAVIRTLQEDEQELGCIEESTVLRGNLHYSSDLKRLNSDQEKILLVAMHEQLVQKGFCLREEDKGVSLLVFPSYARRERTELIEHPTVQVSYLFEGFVDDIYATLVVRLDRTSSFQMKAVWNGAADFATETGKKLGLKLTRLSGGRGELLLFFDPAIEDDIKMAFSRFVQEHLYRKVKYRDHVIRLRHWVCNHCGEPVENRKTAMNRLKEKGKSANILCVNCEERVTLWDAMEQKFADPELMAKVHELEKEVEIELDNESKERILVGEVITIVAKAAQISREFSVSDHGIDMELEFKNSQGEASGKRLYLQLKSGDSYIYEAKRKDIEVFTIKDSRHTIYWQNHAYPVMLVHRKKDGLVRWMEISSYLKRESEEGTKEVKQIIFEGEEMTVDSIRSWRDKFL